MIVLRSPRFLPVGPVLGDRAHIDGAENVCYVDEDMHGTGNDAHVDVTRARCAGGSNAFVVGLLFCLLASCPLCGAAQSGKVYFVAPGGSDRASGSEEDPFATIGHAASLCRPGDEVLIREGVYDIDLTLWRSGEPGRPIVLGAYPGERVILDGSSYVPGIDTQQLVIVGNWIVVHDLEVRNGPAEGVLVIYGAGHVTIDRVVAYANASTGIQLDHDVHDVLVRDCDSWGNVDRLTHGEHADGFAAKFGVGSGNRFTGCRAWNNADDGFDLYDARSAVEIDHCWSFGNGHDRWLMGSNFAGDGNGFKLGAGRHVVHHCLAWHNARRGFDDNDSMDPVVLANNTSWDHPLQGYQFTHGHHLLVNNVSLDDAGNAFGTSAQEHNSWNAPPGNRVTDADFLSLDDGDATGPRRADGGLPLLDFLRPKPRSRLVDAGIDAGFGWEGTAPDLGAVETGLPPESPRHPFPVHVIYPGAASSFGVIAHGSADGELEAFWDHWRREYLVSAGQDGAGHALYRVAFGPRGTKNHRETVSEGQGYGMILVVQMAGYESQAREVFDGLWRYARSHPSHEDPHFMVWILPERSGELDSAFDGDADMALALLMAREQWGDAGDIDYGSEATQLVAAMARRLLGPHSHLPLLGDWVDAAGQKFNEYTVRTSDFMPASFHLFAHVAFPEAWHCAAEAVRLAASGLQTRFARSTGLLPDFAVPTSTEDLSLVPAPADFIEGPGDGAFSYNACRDPWRFAIDVLWNQNAHSSGVVRRLSRWIETAAGGDPMAVMDGYALDGTALPGTEPGSAAFLGPLGAAACAVPGQDSWLDALWEAVHRRHQGYYEDSLNLLSMLVMANDFWLPESYAPQPRWRARPGVRRPKGVRLDTRSRADGRGGLRTFGRLWLP